MTQLGGIHHVTAIATDPQRNVDFYLQTLGLRLLKQTVNFDAPDVYHLYYGDEAGTPGTILTFFPWPGSPPGRRGAGPGDDHVVLGARGVARLVARTARRPRRRRQPRRRAAPARRRWRCTIPTACSSSWSPIPEADPRPPWERGAGAGRARHPGAALGHAHRERFEDTAELLTGTLGFELVEEDGRAGSGSPSAGGGPGTVVDVVCSPESDARAWWPRAPSTTSPGATPDDAQQVAWREDLVGQASTSRRSSTGSTSARSTSASRAACCSRSPPTARLHRSTSRCSSWVAGCGCRRGWSPSGR